MNPQDRAAQKSNFYLISLLKYNIYTLNQISMILFTILFYQYNICFIWIFHRCLHYLKVVIFWECRFLITAVLCGPRQFYALMSSSDNRGHPLITRKFDKQFQISRKFAIFSFPVPNFKSCRLFLCLNTHFSDLTWI